MSTDRLTSATTGTCSERRADTAITWTEGVSAMADTVTDPVCGMQISREDAAASEQYAGRTVYFCSRGCRDAFVQDPHRYRGHTPDQR